MPPQRRIDINPNPHASSPRAVFDPDPLQAKTRDQIFWANRDTEAHWPGRLRDDETIDETFFIPNQIAPDGDTSAIFAPTAATTYRYACSLHPDERGTIQVTEAE